MVWLWLISSAMADPVALEQVRLAERQRLPVSVVLPYAASSDAEVRRAAVVALGRLGRPEGLGTVIALGKDTDSDVALAAAEAIGFIEGSADAIETWFGELPPPRSPAKQARQEGGLRAIPRPWQELW